MKLIEECPEEIWQQIERKVQSLRGSVIYRDGPYGKDRFITAHVKILSYHRPWWEERLILDFKYCGFIGEELQKLHVRGFDGCFEVYETRWGGGSRGVGLGLRIRVKRRRPYRPRPTRRERLS